MKSLILIVIGICIYSLISAQDTIVMKNGNEIRAKVLEIGISELKYKAFDNLDGPIITISKWNVFMIKYKNGTKTVIDEKSTNGQKEQNVQKEQNIQNERNKPKAQKLEKPEKIIIQKKPDTIPKKPYKSYVGVAAGFSSGIGVSYRYQPGKFGVQATILPYKDDLTSIFISGLTFLYRLREWKRINFFIYESNEYYFYRQKKTYDYYYPNKSNTYYDKYEYSNFGLGMGLEFLVIKQRIGIDVMGGYASYENQKRISLTGETGIFYRFK